MGEITEGFGMRCDDVGGVSTWHIFENKTCAGVSNIASSAYALGEITALDLVTGVYAYPVLVEEETSTFTDTSVGEKANKAYGRDQSATMVIHRNDAGDIDRIENIDKGRYTVIATLNDGTNEVLFFENGAKCNDERTPGTAYEDGNMNTLTFTGKEKIKAMKISNAILLTLLNPPS
tara:strand:- start:1489 stop:2019 length:531 start_codon:yes stop_codon:yes gene_type:complete